jgi:multidrug resistance efflux pump
MTALSADLASRSPVPRPDATLAQSAAQATLLAALVRIESRVREAKRVEELAFTIANETWQIAPYRQAFVWLRGGGDRSRLACVSGLAQLGEDSPMTVWLKRLARHTQSTEPKYLTVDEVPAEFAEGWREWLPPYMLVWPMVAPDGTRAGELWLACDEPVAEAAQDALGQAVDAYGYSLWALGRRRHALGAMWRWTLKLRWIVLAALVASMFIPVRMSVLAPAEVSALDAVVVSAPLEGVVRAFQVKPNDTVKQGQLLFTLDDTTLRNRREVATKQLAIARADAMGAQQKAFESETSRGDLAVLQGRVRERQAEVAFLDEQIQRIEVRAPRDGIAVFGDINDWIGKPLATGERVMLLADPAAAGVLVWLPVADAINIAPGAPIRLFLSTAPLDPLAATLTETSYQAAVSPDGVASYRLRGTFDASVRDARIGLKGTAKVYGDRAALGYYLFRRPLASLRQWTGL